MECRNQWDFTFFPIMYTPFTFVQNAIITHRYWNAIGPVGRWMLLYFFRQILHLHSWHEIHLSIIDDFSWRTCRCTFIIGFWGSLTEWHVFSRPLNIFRTRALNMIVFNFYSNWISKIINMIHCNLSWCFTAYFTNF